MAWIRKRPEGLVYQDESKAEAGYTLFAPVRGQHANLLDPAGRIVHRWHCDEGIQYARMLDNGNLLCRSHPPQEADGLEQIGGSTAALIELDWNGNEVWSHRDPTLHHDFHRLLNGNTLIIRWEKMPHDVSQQVRGGFRHHEDPEHMWGDVIEEITPAGAVVDRWVSWEHLSFEEDVICPLESHREWTHANSIDITGAGQLLLSFRLTNTVGLVDRESGAFTWKWGPRVLSHQHSARWLGEGRVLLFDNGCHRRRSPGFAQVLEVDSHTDEIEWMYRAPSILAFNSFMTGGAERLPAGNTFIAEGATGRLFEVTPDGETVWEYVSPFVHVSRFGPTPAVFRAHRYPLDDPRFAGRDLNPHRYAELNRRIATGEFTGEGVNIR